MADIAISELDEVTSVSDADVVPVTVDIGGGVLVTKKIQYSNLLGSSSQKVRGLIVDPSAVYANRPLIILMRVDAAITITRIHIRCSTTAYELSCRMAYTDNPVTFATTTVIAVCDTTSGAFTMTSGFTNASVASGKYIYLFLDAAPNANIDDFYLELFYNYN